MDGMAGDERAHQDVVPQAAHVSLCAFKTRRTPPVLRGEKIDAVCTPHHHFLTNHITRHRIQSIIIINVSIF